MSFLIVFRSSPVYNQLSRWDDVNRLLHIHCKMLQNSQRNMILYINSLKQNTLKVHIVLDRQLKDLTAANMSVLRGCLVDGAREGVSCLAALWSEGRAMCGQEWSGCEVCVRAMCGRGLCGCATSSGQTSCEVVRNQG
ncbi:hypothetical protein YC2023_015790 [Brassica napus]